jgi:hypothetical protein
VWWLSIESIPGNSSFDGCIPSRYEYPHISLSVDSTTRSTKSTQSELHKAREKISLNPKPFYQGINHPIYGQRQDPPLYCSPSMSTITSPRAQDALGNQSCSRWNQEVDLNIFPFQSSSLNPSIGARAYEFPAVHTRRHCISAVGGNRGSLGIPKESARYTGTGGNLNPRFGQTLG